MEHDCLGELMISSFTFIFPSSKGTLVLSYQRDAHRTVFNV